jgi:hypothetical protein
MAHGAEYVPMIKEICGAIILGITGSLFLLQNDPYVKKSVFALYRSAFESALMCKMDAEEVQLNFFIPELKLLNMRVTPQEATDTGWEWTCSQYRAHFSWLHFITHRVMNFSIYISDCIIHSLISDKKKVAMQPLIERLCATSDTRLPFYTQLFSLTNATLTLKDENKNTVLNACCDSLTKKIDNNIKSKIYIRSGTVSRVFPVTITDIAGNIMMSTVNNTYNIIPDIGCNIKEWHNDGRCFIGGAWNNSHGRLFFRNSEQSCIINPIIISSDNGSFSLKIQGRCPAAYIVPHITEQENFIPYEGICTVRAHATYENGLWECDGYATAERVMCKYHPQPLTAKCLLRKQDNIWNATAALRCSIGDITAQGEWDHRHGTGKIKCTNQSDLNHRDCSQWSISSGDAAITADLSSDRSITSQYHVTVKQKTHDTPYTSAGSMKMDAEKNIAFAGDCAGYFFSASATPEQFPYVHTCNLHTQKNKPVLSLCKTNTAHNRFSGIIHLDQIRHLFNSFTGYECHAQGAVQYNATLHNKTIECDLQLNDGIIRFGDLHNFITRFSTQCTLSPEKYSLTLCNSRAYFNQGEIRCPHAVIRLMSDKKFFVYAPLILDYCYTNYKNDFFAMVSGNITLSYPRAITGTVIIDHALLKENIFSPYKHKNVHTLACLGGQPHTSPCTLSIQLLTRDSLRIDTPFLTTDAHIAVRVENNFEDPHLIGRIQFKGGELQFPYKPLFIQSGHLIFSVGNPDNPLISMVARNTIRSHDITLQVSGSLLDWHMRLMSTPALAEEQIMSLLCAGSQESLLNVIPALVVQNLPQLIFGSRHSLFMEKYFKPFIKPLAINLIPSFADHTGRGGLRGGIEITANDRIRALIQKNFNLTEDTRFELEYLVSDDVTVRAIRDERRDIGAECEVKWKF